MKVIIIIVTYNGMKWYANCFNSLRNSTIPLHTIVIDNNSSDDTVTFIKENYPEIHLVESNENLGFGKANNLGFKYATEQDADFVFLLNQDAWVKPNTLEGLIEIQKENLKYGILSPIQIDASEKKLDNGFLYYLEPNNCPQIVSDALSTKEKKVENVYPINFTNAAMWLISKDCYQTVGGFDPLFFHYGEDVNYTHRTKYYGFEIGICPHLFAIHDRNNNPQKAKTFSKKKKDDYIYFLTQIANINESLPAMIYRLQTLFISQFINNLLRLKLKDALINICTSFSLLINTFKILKARNREKQEGAYLKS